MTTKPNGPEKIGPEVAAALAASPSRAKSSPCETSRNCAACGLDPDERGVYLIEGLCPRCRIIRDERIARWDRCGVGVRHRRIRTWAELRAPPTGFPAYRAAEDALKKFLADPRGAILVLLGVRGTGKTQLCAVAIAETIAAGRWAMYTTVADLLADLKSRYGSGEPSDGDAAWLLHWGNPFLLCIDEIAERLDSAWSGTMLAALLDLRYRELRPTILAGNVSRADLPEVLPASICSRINEHGGVIECNWSSFREYGHSEERP